MILVEQGHNFGVLCAQFLPGTLDTVMITGGADSEIRLLDLSYRVNSPRIDQVYQCHNRPVRQIGVFEDKPFEFLSCSDDGKPKKSSIHP